MVNPSSRLPDRRKRREFLLRAEGNKGEAVNARVKRLAENEALFREVNENIEAAASPQGPHDGHLFGFFCECSDLRCTQLVLMDLREYEAVRANARAFVVAAGHELPEIETVMEHHQRYQVVVKVGEAAELAEDRDPRG